MSAALSSVDHEQVGRLARRYFLTRAQALLLFHLGGSKTTLSAQWLISNIGGLSPSKDSLRVQVHRLRKKVAPLRIRNQRRLGYWIEGEDLAAVQAVMRGAS